MNSVKNQNESKELGNNLELIVKVVVSLAFLYFGLKLVENFNVEWRIIKLLFTILVLTIFGAAIYAIFKTKK